MDRVEDKPAQEVQCDRCGKVTPNYDIVNYSSAVQGYSRVCGQCFNAEVATRGGLEKFEHLSFEPVRLVDCAGRPHDFHFRVNSFGPGVAIDAFELRDRRPAGYQFQMIGD